MIKILVRLDFFYDGEDTIDQFILMVKSGTSFDDVEEELLKAHKYLCEEDETDLYNIGEAVELFLSHFDNNDKIQVLVDEDVDGKNSNKARYIKRILLSCCYRKCSY